METEHKNEHLKNEVFYVCLHSKFLVCRRLQQQSGTAHLNRDVPLFQFDPFSGVDTRLFMKTIQEIVHAEGMGKNQSPEGDPKQFFMSYFGNSSFIISHLLIDSVFQVIQHVKTCFQLQHHTSQSKRCSSPCRSYKETLPFCVVKWPGANRAEKKDDARNALRI